MIKHEQFKVNEAWLVFRINYENIYIQDEAYDMYMLMDIGSGFILGQLASKVVDNNPSEEGVKSLLNKAWSEKNKWPQTIYFEAGSPAVALFQKQVESHPITTEEVQAADLQSITKAPKDSFAASLKQST